MLTDLPDTSVLCDLDEIEGFNSNQRTITNAYTTGYREEYARNIGGQCVLGTSKGIWDRTYNICNIEWRVIRSIHFQTKNVST